MTKGWLKSLALVVAMGSAHGEENCPSNGPTVPPPNVEDLGSGLSMVTSSVAADGELITLALFDDLGELLPVARSYDGRGWEVSPGPFADGKVSIGCDASSCAIDVSNLGRTGTLKKTTYSAYLDPASSEDDKRSAVARFLEQATFGPSLSEITNFGTNFGDPTEANLKSWIIDQIETVPLSSHREFYRRHTNPRWDRVSQSARSLPSPCNKFARWRTVPLTSRDYALKTLVVEAYGDKFMLKVNGEFRTLVDNIDLEDSEGAAVIELLVEYPLCNPGREFWQEAVGQPFPEVEIDNECYPFKNGAPSLDIEGVSGLPLVDLTGATLEPIDNVQYNSTNWDSVENITDYILQEEIQGCDSMPSPYGVSDGQPGPTIFGKWNDMTLVYDPRLVLEENTVENPLPDGGGAAVHDTNGQMWCSSAPRSFINEDECVLTTSPQACSDEVPPVMTVTLDDTTISTIEKDNSTNIYVFVDIPFTTANYSETESFLGYGPCFEWHWDVRVRFERMDDTNLCNNALIVQQATRDVFAKYLNPEFNEPINPNPRYKTVRRQVYNRCDPIDEAKNADELSSELLWLGYMQDDEGTCWKHVHPLEGNMYELSSWSGDVDLSQWTTVPGTNNVLSFSNSSLSAETDGNKWIYENVHGPESRLHYVLPGHLEDVVEFDSIDIPDTAIAQPLVESLGKISSNAGGSAVVVCGSIGEVANDPSVGEGFQYAWSHFRNDLDVANDMDEQRHTIWAYLALNAPDQLRQRMAWALSQINVVGHEQLDDRNTEAVLQYYDIFVRHAFGSYRDIMKKVSFSDAMAKFLSSRRNKSFQYSQSQGIEAFPDENYAREILQLFTVGLVRLNMDGTTMLDENGQPIESYDNIDLVSYSRAWTGLETPDKRGNQDGDNGRVDPMVIENDWHDVFPKTDLMGGYIGDRKYPLCTDLPKRHALRKGATFRLLGTKNTPDLIYEQTYSWADWGDLSFLERLELSEDSPLYAALCVESGGQCTFPAKVVLNENLDYRSTLSQEGLEYKSQSLRTIKVKSGVDAIYYEYVRQPCVELSFFKDGIKVQDDMDRVDGADPRLYTVESSMCADPRRDVATESCCNTDYVEGVAGVSWREQGFKFCNFFGERMTYDMASSRCAENGKKLCTTQWWSSYNTGYCGHDLGRDHYFYWTTQGCRLAVKINANNEIAIIHDVEADYAGNKTVWEGVDTSTRNFFRPAWINSFDQTQCAGVPGCEVITEGCLCTVMVDESVAFSTAPSTKDEVLEKCFIGGVDPSMAPEEYNTLPGACSIDGIRNVYSKRSSDCSRLGPDVVFEYIDEFGFTRFAKNLISTVEIGDNYSFRTPVQFINFIDPELRDTLYEFEEILDSMFYHPNHPPFMAKSLLQRFGHSNPSPELIKTVAEAYKAGSYNGIGSNEYGDLGALVAAILLHPESTSVSLPSDPTFGQIREPIVKIVAFMRALEYQHDSPLFIPLLDSLQSEIRQGTYQQPSVFNYYLPEYSPPGPIGASGLVSPESMILAGEAITKLLDGLFRLVKNGLDDCYAGFARYRPFSCSTSDGDMTWALGALGYNNLVGSHDEVLKQLSLVLTSSRLDYDKLQLIKVATADDFLFGDRSKAIRAMMQLIASTAEFQTTALAKNTPVIREPEVETRTASSDYKAVIYLFYNGGMDSWNMIAPKGNCHADYLDVRGPNLAVPLDDLLDITAEGQECSEFGVNKEFPIGQELYNAKEMSYFVNMGLLQQPVDKLNYTITQSRLFSHNSQQYAIQKLDIKNVLGETGVGGRLMDELDKLNYLTSSNSVSGHAHLAAGDPKLSNPTRQISSGNPEEFNRYPTMDPITARVKQLNGVGNESHVNNRFAETWSASLMQAFNENDEAFYIVENPEFDIESFPTGGAESSLDRKFKATAQYIKSREYRNVDRELFVIEDGGYDMHECNCVADKLKYIEQSLRDFRDEMKNQTMWENVVIVTGSDFGRTLTPNSGGGTDHAWAGHYFMLGGDVDGGKIWGTYPDVTENSPYRLKTRGRMVPTTSYDAMWTGVAQWMGVTSEDAIDYMLPDRKNFDRCEMFTDAQLFKNGGTPPYMCSEDSATTI